MTKNIELYGICSTCNNQSSCLSFQKSVRLNKPVWYCEEFANFTPGMKLDVDNNAEKVSYKPQVNTKEVIPDRSIGLCMNCENRESCMLPFPAGGVVYCEEYSNLPRYKRA